MYLSDYVKQQYISLMEGLNGTIKGSFCGMRYAKSFKIANTELSPDPRTYMLLCMNYIHLTLFSS